MSNSKDSLNRSDIESSLIKEFPNLTKAQISKSIDVIIDSIVEAVSYDEKVEIRGFGTFSKKYIRPRRFVNPKTKRRGTCRHLSCVSVQRPRSRFCLTTSTNSLATDRVSRVSGRFDAVAVKKVLEITGFSIRQADSVCSSISR